MSNHVLIRLIRFVSRFTIYLCNAIYFLTIFSTPCKRFTKILYFTFWDALFGRRGAKSRLGLSTTKEKVKAWLELWLLALHFFSHLRPDWAIQRVLFTSQVLKRWTGGEKVKGEKVSPTDKVSFRRERACSKHKKDRKVQINSMPLTNKGESNTTSTLYWNLYPVAAQGTVLLLPGSRTSSNVWYM